MSTKDKKERDFDIQNCFKNFLTISTKINYRKKSIFNEKNRKQKKNIESDELKKFNQNIRLVQKSLKIACPPKKSKQIGENQKALKEINNIENIKHNNEKEEKNEVNEMEKSEEENNNEINKIEGKQIKEDENKIEEEKINNIEENVEDLNKVNKEDSKENICLEAQKNRIANDEKEYSDTEEKILSENQNNNILEGENKKLQTEEINEENIQNIKEEGNGSILKGNNDKITINSTKNNVISFLKNELNVNSEKLEKMNNEEIDGEVLILFRKKDFKEIIGFNNEERKNILKHLERDILEKNDNIIQNVKYKKIFIENVDDLWDSLEETFSNLKYGERLKFLKYLLIRDPPPKEEKNRAKYFRKVLSVDKSTINKIKEKFNNLLTFNEMNFEEQCEDWELPNEDIYKLKIIIELIKQENKDKSSINTIKYNNEEQNQKINENNEDKNIEHKKDKILLNEKEEEKKENNIEAAPNSFSLSKTPTKIDDNDKYSQFYCVIEIFKYQTSQKEITYGLKNSINEFQKICDDFKINYENECFFIEYNEAKNIKLSSFMLWGTKEGLNHFLKTIKQEKNFEEYINKNQNKDKEGIYLCINITKGIAYVLIWPGEHKFKNNLSNSNILLTLIRYGFSITVNSILCMSENEINKFNRDQYEYFNDEELPMGTETYIFENNKYSKKIFTIKNSDDLSDNLKDKLKSKKIIEGKLNKNCLLLYEELGDRTITKEKKNVEFNEFIKDNIKDKDIYFDDTFNISDVDEEDFYFLIKKNKCFLNNKTKWATNSILKDIVKSILDTIINDRFNELFELDNLKKKFICKYCNSRKKDLYYNSKNEYFHETCYKKYNKSKKFKFKELDVDGFIFNKYNESKNNILKKTKNDKIFDEKMINNFFENCEKNFLPTNSIFTRWINKTLLINTDIISKYIDILKYEVLKYNFEKEDKINKIIGKEYNECKNLLKKNDEQKNKKYQEWIKNWKETINKYFNDNRQKINKWVLLKSYEKKKKKLFRNKLEYKVLLCYDDKEIIKQKNIIVNLYEIMPIKDSQNICFSDVKELGEKDRIENYFSQEGKGFIIYKNGDKIQITIRNNQSREFVGLFDYDIFSQTYVFYREEDKRKKVLISYIDENKKLIDKDIDINDIIEPNTKINKILLIPCYAKEFQSILLFTDTTVYIKKIKGMNYGKELVLEKYFKFNTFNELQIIVHLDFLLILHFDKNKKIWIGKVFLLILEDSESLFNEVTSIELKEIDDEDAKFSFSEIKDKKYIFSINIKDNIPILRYWEIHSQLSGISMTCYTPGKKTKKSRKIFSPGNCIVNYFYHCFYKYPLQGAIQYMLREYMKKSIRLGFFLEKYKANTINDLKSYINELKSIYSQNKKISFDDIDFNYIDDYKNFYEIKESSLGDLLINLLEITPIQIAKIMENDFKIISNNEIIDEKISIEINKRRRNNDKDEYINSSDLSKMINFCNKESILNYFELPVIVICCFGTQSVGKSTFLNELTGSLFDVSGMRCTEGIWMSIKLFLNTKINEEKCNKKCNNCKKNKCYLLRHKENICICKECICGKECCINKNNDLINCDLKCCLNKGHEDLIKCTFKGCECKCVCNCICKKNEIEHGHICKFCEERKVEKCFCKCNCKHICKYPILLHNFFCVCLDFEGLGTFERTNEQDIQMALIGSAMGNNVIFRTYSSFDKFTEGTLKKLNLGSRKIKNIDLKEFFGGSLILSPRDVMKNEQENINREFKEKVKSSITQWNEEYSNNDEDNNNQSKKYTIFGLFNSNIIAPTPSYTEKAFFSTLRKVHTIDILENSFKFQRHPIYKTGKEFCLNLKMLLSAVFLNDYESLQNFKENKIREYINENLIKAFEVSGVYENYEEKNINLKNILIDEKEGLKINFNKDYLNKLEINIVSNEKLENDNALKDCIINEVFCFLKLHLKIQRFTYLILKLKKTDFPKR